MTKEKEKTIQMKINNLSILILLWVLFTASYIAVGSSINELWTTIYYVKDYALYVYISKELMSRNIVNKSIGLVFQSICIGVITGVIYRLFYFHESDCSVIAFVASIIAYLIIKANGEEK